MKKSYRYTIDSNNPNHKELYNFLESLSPRERNRFTLLSINILAKQINYNFPKGGMYEIVLNLLSQGNGFNNGFNTGMPQPLYQPVVMTQNRQDYCNPISETIDEKPYIKEDTTTINKVDESIDSNSEIANFILGTLDFDE